MGFGTNVGLLDVAVTLSVWLSLVAPVERPERFTTWAPASSRMLTSPIAASVGASFTAVTVRLTVAVEARAFPFVSV